jgi:uncharacterized coiled-coil protein SlyX
MNESLKEKDIEDHPYVKWLEKKVEDAQKEIDFQKARTDVANEMVTSKQKKIDELKQKLQLLWNTIPLDFNLDSGEVSLVGLIDTKRQWRDWLKKFEGLLKEEKAKPT